MTADLLAPNQPLDALTSEAAGIEADGGSSPTLGAKLASLGLTVLMVLMLAGVGAVALVPRLTGSVALTVLTGSMTPALNPGDLIVVRPTPLTDIQPGDVVTFQYRSGDPTLVTHRVVEVLRDGPAVTGLITQGDANRSADRPLVPEQVKGVVWYHIPLIGHLTGGNTILLAGAAVGIGLLAFAAVTLLKPDPKPAAAEHAEPGTAPRTP